VLNGGRVAELGTQVELLRKNGLYKQLYDAQVGALRQKSQPLVSTALGTG